MFPLLFAVGHTHYARYASYEIRSIEGLLDVVAKKFLKGEHTMHHKTGLCNDLWNDMAIGTTYMRYDHRRSGIIGITLKPDTLKIFRKGHWGDISAWMCGSLGGFMASFQKVQDYL